MASIWTLLLPGALGLWLATDAVAQHKTEDPVAPAATHLKAGKLEAAKAEQLLATLNKRKQNRKAAFQEEISGSH